MNDLEPLTPNHILLGLHRNWHYVCNVNDKDITSRRRYRQVQAFVDQFWIRWRREYLPQLNKRHRWQQRGSNIKIGDLVAVIDDNDLSRKWNLGRISKVMPSSDGVVRVVEIRTKSGLYTRPVVKLYRLEERLCQGEEC